MTVRFAEPLYLLLLLLLPLCARLGARLAPRPSLRVATAGPWAECDGGRLWWFRRGLPALKWTALAWMILALARPQWGSHRFTASTEGINIVIALDTSESMAALDFKRGGKVVNRLEAIKAVAADFVARRGSDRIALVVFGAEAYTQLPLTSDHQALTTVLERLTIGAAGKSTAIGNAIGIALKRLSDVPGKSSVIVLLTDGRSNSGELTPEVSTAIAVEKGVKIYTIGVGSRGPVPFLIKDPVFGQRLVTQRVDIDEPTLRKIADATGGVYFRAEDADGLAKITATIDRLEKTQVEVTRYAEYQDGYVNCLLFGLVLLIFWVVLSNTRYLELP